MNHLPKLIRPASPPEPTDHSIHFSPLLAEVARLEVSEVFTRMKTTSEGLSDGEAASRFAEVGPNVVAANDHRGWPWRLLTATRNPLVILLAVLATISFATGAGARVQRVAAALPEDPVGDIALLCCAHISSEDVANP